jgi:hypothetical protein
MRIKSDRGTLKMWMQKKYRAWWICLAIGALGLGNLALRQKSGASGILGVADEMVKEVVQLRGLKPNTSIRMGVKSRVEISKYLNEYVSKNYSDDDLRREGDILRKIGLIPEAMDYRDFMLKLLTEQVGGFYDPDEKTFYIAGWISADEQKPVMIHELTHAIQDQHFDLNRILRDPKIEQNDDEGLARQAVLEGDGVAVMMNYLLAGVKRDFASLPNLAFIMRSMSSSTQAQLAIYSSAPLYLQEMLVFPYGYGAAFLQKLWNKTPSWEAVNKIYSDLPLSTEQIMHPEKYLDARDDPKPIDVQDPAKFLGESWKATYTNVLGEFSLNIMMRLHLGEEQANRAAEGWGGDRVVLLEDEQGKNGILISSVWDSSAEADEFFQASNDWLAKRHADAIKTEETPDKWLFRKNGELDALVRNGAQISLILGFPEAAGLKLIQ